jgi:hypothetical protein
VQISYTGDEFRPAFHLLDVADADFNHVKAQRTTGVPEFVLKNVTNFSAHYVLSQTDTNMAKTENGSL